MLSKEIHTQLVDFFRDKPVVSAYVFGSFARNEETAESDIDILVDLDYTQEIGLQFLQMQEELETLLDREVDLVSSGGLSPYIKPLIEQEKLLIYARN